jgi:polyisoprenoid-binding protein YceI
MKKVISTLFVATLFVVHSAFTPVSDGTHEVDPNSSTVTWTASKITGDSHTGTVSIKSGSFDISEGMITRGAFVIDMTTINNTDLSGGMKGKLEGHLASDDFFSIEKHPTASLKIKSSEGHDGHMHVTADLTIKGITNEVTFDAKLIDSDGAFNAKADITVDRSKFDVRYGSDSFFDNLGNKAINNDIVFSVELNGKQR